MDSCEVWREDDWDLGGDGSNEEGVSLVRDRRVWTCWIPADWISLGTLRLCKSAQHLTV